jgi:hypothetical protein
MQTVNHATKTDITSFQGEKINHIFNYTDRFKNYEHKTKRKAIFLNTKSEGNLS